MRALHLCLLLLAAATAQGSSSAATADCDSSGDVSCLVAQQEGVFDPIGQLSEQISSFLKDNIFNQKEGSSTGSSSLTFPKLDSSEGDDPLFQKLIDSSKKLFDGFKPDIPSKDDSMQSTQFEGVFGSVIAASSTKSSRSMEEVWSMFSTFFNDSLAQLKDHFKDVNFDHFNVLAVWYFLELIDEQKNPSWKRRKHRFHKQVPINSIVKLHNALYLSQLAYAGSVDVIKDGLEQFLDSSFRLVYAKTEGLPGEPGHFIAIKKEKANEKGKIDPLEVLGLKPKDDSLEVLMVVRGTKELGDMLSDTLLDATDFRDGRSHSGVSKSGEWLVAEHLEMLRSLLDVSERKKLKLTLIGHSLGAGAAAIAALHFNDEEWIDVNSIGFGCPALLDLPQSLAAQDYIVTVITDSDIVPRLSGAAMVNAFLDIMSYDWTAKALEDIKLTAAWLNLPNQEGIVEWVDDIMEKNDRPYFSDCAEKKRMEQLLYPPGTCIHLFRDGSGFQATYTSCSFFDSIDLSRTMIDDHLIPTGYHRAFLELLRDNRKDYGADFDHDLMALNV
jgi:hypothetical protein